MLTPNDPIGSTRISVARLMQLRAAEELVERAVRAAESASDLLKAARRERDEAQATLAAVARLEIDAEQHRQTMTLPAPKLTALLGEAMCKMFVAAGGENVVEWRLETEKLGRLCMTLQRVEGKTPMELCDEAKEQRDALKAIVARLPKTADGVPVTPGMELYRRDLRFVKGDQCFVAEVMPLTHDCLTFEEWKFDGWYSTREVAERAKGGE